MRSGNEGGIINCQCAYYGGFFNPLCVQTALLLSIFCTQAGASKLWRHIERTCNWGPASAGPIATNAKPIYTKIPHVNLPPRW